MYSPAENITTPPFYLYRIIPRKIAEARPVATCSSTKLNKFFGTPKRER